MKRSPSAQGNQRGYVLSTEFLIFIIVMVMGLLVAWVTIRDSFNAELMDTSNAIESSITYFYFNDPLRGTGGPFVNDELEFVLPGEENTTFTVPAAPAFPTITPSTGISPTGEGTRVPLPGSEAPGPIPTPSSTGTVSLLPGSESAGPAADPSLTGTVEELEGSESGGG